MLPESFLEDLLKSVGEFAATFFSLIFPKAASWLSGVSAWEILIASGVLPLPLIAWLVWRTYCARQHAPARRKS